MKKGKLITLEGGEGSGKSLQLTLLERELWKHRIPCVTTREPGGTALGHKIRDILLYRNGPNRHAVAELLLYLADRYQHVKEIVEPALERGLYVLSDRYHDATLVYQGYARGIGFDLIDQLSEILQLPVPDLTLILEIDTELGLQRAKRRDQEDGKQDWGRFEAEDPRFHRKVRKGYSLLAQREPERIQILDASGLPEEVSQRVLTCLCERKLLPS